ncbi:MAG: hypothetical protein OXE04_04300 [bacterium]|nr:hypothetical protein [bacterium]
MKKPIIFAIAVVSVLAATAGVLAATGIGSITFSGRQSGSPIKDHYVLTGTMEDPEGRGYFSNSQEIRLRPGVYRYTFEHWHKDVIGGRNYPAGTFELSGTAKLEEMKKNQSIQFTKHCAQTYMVDDDSTWVNTGTFSTNRNCNAGHLTLTVNGMSGMDWVMVFERVHRFKD